MQHQYRVLLGNPHLAATYTISVHVSRKGSAEEETFQTKILMCVHSLLDQNILSEFPPPSLPALGNSSLQAGPALFSSCQGAVPEDEWQEPPCLHSVGEDKAGLDDLTGRFQSD